MASEYPIQYSINLDGDEIGKMIEDTIRKGIDDHARTALRKELSDLFFKREQNWPYGYTKITQINPWVIEVTKEILEEHKDEIVAAAAKELAVSMSRSRPFREKFSDIFEGEAL